MSFDYPVGQFYNTGGLGITSTKEMLQNWLNCTNRLYYLFCEMSSPVELWSSEGISLFGKIFSRSILVNVEAMTLWHENVSIQ